MGVVIRIPSSLRLLTGGAGQVVVDAATAGEALAALEREHPGFRERLFDADGNLHRFVNVFVADIEIRAAAGLDTEVSGSPMSIVPAVAGG